MVPPMSLAPATTSCWSAMVAITGSAAFASNSAEFAPPSPARLRAASMTMHCRPEAQAQHRDPVDPGVVDRADLALDAADAEAAGDQHALHVGQRGGGAGVGDAVVGGDPDDLDPGVVAEPAGPQRLGHRQVGVRQVDVLADHRDPHRLGRVVHPVQQVAPDASSPRRGRAGSAGAPRRRPAPRGAAPWGCRRSTARPGWRSPPRRRRRTSARSCASAAPGCPGRSGRSARPAGCRCCAARPPSAGWAWSSARRTAPGTAPATRAGRRRAPGRRRGGPAGPPPGTAATRCRRRCRRSR